jgi:hypothetical protein
MNIILEKKEESAPEENKEPTAKKVGRPKKS